VHEGSRGDEADGEAFLAGGQAEAEGCMGLAGAARSSVILPGVRRLRFGYSIRFTRAVARRWWWSARGGTLAPNTSSSDSLTARWRCCRHG
jgi:hypothetical protein